MVLRNTIIQNPKFKREKGFKIREIKYPGVYISQTLNLSPLDLLFCH